MARGYVAAPLPVRNGTLPDAKIFRQRRLCLTLFFEQPKYLFHDEMVHLECTRCQIISAVGMRFDVTTRMIREINRKDCLYYTRRVVELIDDLIDRNDIPASKYKEKFGVGRSMLSMMRTGKRLPSLETLLKISLETGQGIDALLGWRVRR